MKILIACLNDSNLYPSPYFIASALANHGHDVTFLSRIRPMIQLPREYSNVPKWRELSTPGPIENKIPFIRGNYHRVFNEIIKIKPDVFIGQHQLAMIGAVYSLFNNKTKVIPYFCDHMVGMWYSSMMRRLAYRYAGYIDICDLRVAWRKNEWAAMQCPTFVIRQAPPLGGDEKLMPHDGAGRLVFTGSDYGEDMQWDLLSRFIRAVTERGVDFDWYMPGKPEKREKAKAIVDNRHFRVLEPVDKAQLLKLLPEYDVGLLWAPVRLEQRRTPRTVWDHNLLSAASNKICEYHAAGLVSVHTGNPGLHYLPTGVSQVINPWEPEASAERIAAFLEQRSLVEEGRRAAFDYYKTTMNAEWQVAPLIQYIQTFEPLPGAAVSCDA